MNRGQHHYVPHFASDGKPRSILTFAVSGIHLYLRLGTVIRAVDISSTERKTSSRLCVIVAIGNPERHVHTASHRGSKQQ